MAVSRTISVAPMMELTDRHFRFLVRLLTRHTLLYTEMLTSKAVLHGDRTRLLKYDCVEHPVALQLGGSEPDELALAAKVGADMGYDEINLNVGCPSDRVKSGRFGACLMAQPQLVGRCIESMQRAVEIPVTVKCRIGIDRIDSWESLFEFVRAVSGYGCTVFAVHARKAWLDGLSPKENRSIPPLRYDFVYQLKEQMPQLTVVINGGIKTWSEIHTHLQRTDGVMIGREAYYNPCMLRDVDKILYDDARPQLELHEVAMQYAHYMQLQYENGVPLSSMTRHLIALFQHVPGARAWRRHLSSTHKQYTNAVKLVEDALVYLSPNEQSHTDYATTPAQQSQLGSQ